jgi:hypothetical protein
MLHYEGRTSFEDFLKQVALELASRPEHKLNAYFMATDCGLKSYARSKRKLEIYAYLNKMELVKGEYKGFDEKQLGLKMPFTSALQLKAKWLELLSPERHLTASCGCSIFVSDGQAVDIRVLPVTSKLGFE